ncbi:hypothetical protein RDV89_05765 [Nocardioides zeae]|uniref:DUF732 domain-containing protein n=1 Tax=Nocardioides imazamoxiresistens TaxID=3231893 RepID=A0ABU3PTL6_9ACTN|nr:hypothetical protein [Nocardioides zeae]MDT9592561.1 hypothetical protein [Nocardioides zeae]
MANVNLPRPVVGLGAVICVAGGYLLGVVVTADEPDTFTAEVASFAADANTLCLQGEDVSEATDALDGASEGEDVADEVDGEGEAAELCGYWMRPADAPAPAQGDAFEFSLGSSDTPPAGEASAANVLIYGTVVD